MPRPSQAIEKKRELLPRLASAFVQLGYRRATTAALAQRCGVQENVLYRLWADKKAMFLAAVEYVYEFSEQTWLRLLERGADDCGHPPAGASSALRLLEFESRHHGEFGHYRIIFSGLSETDDPDIREALRRAFARFHRFLAAQIIAHRHARAAGVATVSGTAAPNTAAGGAAANDTAVTGTLASVAAAPGTAANGTLAAELTAWAVIGLGTAVNIGRELEMVSEEERRRLIAEIGRLLLEDGSPGV